MTSPTKTRAAYVEWIDSASLAGNTWHDIKDVQALTLEKTRALGFVIGEGPEHITIASHLHDGEAGGEIAIPKCAITKIRRWVVK